MVSVGIAAPPVARHEIDELVVSMSAELDRLAREVCDAIHAHLDEIADDLYVETLHSCRANLGLIHTLLRDGADPRSAVVPSEARAYAKEFAHRGLSFELLQRAYRMGQRTLSARWLSQLRETATDTDHLAAAVGYFNDWLFAYIETIERQITDLYMREREQWLRGAAGMRAETVRALLDGGTSGPIDAADMSRRLGYELSREHVAFLVWTDDSVDDAQELFAERERVAAAVARALGAPGVLTVAHGRALACWAAAGADAPLSYQPRHPLRVAVGSRLAGVEGFQRSHAEALLTRRVAALAGLAGVTHFEDVSLDALLANDLDEARRFVTAELGPLAADDDSARRLRATLTTFLDEGSSYVRAARRLGVHENTVAYRVRRAEELLGHKTCDRQLELRAALRLTWLVGG